MANKIFVSADKASACFNDFITLYGELIFKEHGVFRHITIDHPCSKMASFELSHAILIMLAKHEEYVRRTKDRKGLHFCEERFWSRFTSDIGFGYEPIDLTVFRRIDDSYTDSFYSEWTPKLTENVLD